VDSKYSSAWGGWCFNEVHGSYGVELWKNIRRFWGSFLAPLDLVRGMASKFDSSMMFGVGIELSRHLFGTWLALPVLRILLRQTILSFLVPPISGILKFSERLMIGRWICLPLFSLCSIPSKKCLLYVKSYYNVFVPHDNNPFPWRSIW
jgi:hypothetical protein